MRRRTTVKGRFRPLPAGPRYSSSVFTNRPMLSSCSYPADSQIRTAGASSRQTSALIRLAPRARTRSSPAATSRRAIPRWRQRGWTVSRYMFPRQPSHAAISDPTTCLSSSATSRASPSRSIKAPRPAHSSVLAGQSRDSFQSWRTSASSSGRQDRMISPVSASEDTERFYHPRAAAVLAPPPGRRGSSGVGDDPAP